MAIHITLMKWTCQGSKDIRGVSRRIESAVKSWELMGGRMLGFYVVMGPYDVIAITDGPDDETAAAFSLVLNALGNVQTETLRAFTPEEFADIVNRLP